VTTWIRARQPPMMVGVPGRLSRFAPGRPPTLQRSRTPFGRRDETGKRSVLSQINDLTIKPPSLDVSAPHSAGYPNRICVVVEQTYPSGRDGHGRVGGIRIHSAVA